MRACLTLISELFDKKFDEVLIKSKYIFFKYKISLIFKKKFPFDLIPSNVSDLESMFNAGFGGYTNNESLKNYIFELFSKD